MEERHNNQFHTLSLSINISVDSIINPWLGWYIWKKCNERWDLGRWRERYEDLEMWKESFDEKKWEMHSQMIDSKAKTVELLLVKWLIRKLKLLLELNRDWVWLAAEKESRWILLWTLSRTREANSYLYSFFLTVSQKG